MAGRVQDIRTRVHRQIYIETVCIWRQHGRLSYFVCTSTRHNLMLAILTSVSSHPYATTAVSLLTLYYLIQRLSSSPSRTLIIPANEERVLILGATSGIGREIALRYARRRARVCVVGRRAELLNEVSRDCMQLQTDYTKVLGLVGDFTVVEDMVHVRDALQSSTCCHCCFDKAFITNKLGIRMGRHRYCHRQRRCFRPSTSARCHG